MHEVTNQRGAAASRASARIVVLGSRPDGHAKVIIDCIALLDGLELTGLIDDYSANQSNTIRGHRVIGSIASADALTRRGITGIVLGFGEHRGRAEICARITTLGFQLPRVIHPAALVSTSAVLRDGVQVMAGAVIGVDVELATGSLVNTGAIVDHDVRLGPGTVVGPGATLAGRVSTEQDVSIGAGAVVLPVIRIETGCVVGAGAVVTHHVPAGSVVVGVPARPAG